MQGHKVMHVAILIINIKCSCRDLSDCKRWCLFRFIEPPSYHLGFFLTQCVKPDEHRSEITATLTPPAKAISWVLDMLVPT